MAKFESTNPLLNVERLEARGRAIGAEQSGQALMTLKGTAQKSILLIVLCFITADLIFGHTMTQLQASVAPGMGYTVGAAIMGLIFYFAGLFVNRLAFIFAPLYAIAEGVFLGAISALFEMKYPGVVLNAVVGTIGVFLIMFVGFSMGIFKVTQKFRAIITTCVLGFFLLYLVNFVVSLFAGSGFDFMAVESSNPALSIGISVFAIIVASCTLLLDFDNIAQLHGEVPKSMEWVCGMGLLASLVWLYVELLKLLAKLQSND